VDIVWRQLNEKVKEEIRSMVIKNGEDREVTAAESFRVRTTACKRVFDNLSPPEKMKILDLAKSSILPSNPLDIQQK
jgi:hypothetical protein